MRTPRSHPLEVLVADDDPVACIMLEVYVKMFGCHVHIATDGSEALEMLPAIADELCAIILDVDMPGPRLEFVLDRVRTLNPRLPVLFCSALPSDHRAIRAIVDRRLPLLTKPFNYAQLARALRRLLSDRRNYVLANVT